MMWRLPAARTGRVYTRRLHCAWNYMPFTCWSTPTPSRTSIPRAFACLTRSASQVFGSGDPDEGMGKGKDTHGGDDVSKVGRLVCDFSVTTNALGPVPNALIAAKRLLADVEEEWISPRGGDVKAILEECVDSSEHIASAPAVEHYPRRSDPELEQLTATFLRGGAQATEVQQR